MQWWTESTAEDEHERPAGSTVDVDITRSGHANGVLGNPFPMGVFGRNEERRRDVCDLLYERWLDEGTTPACDMRACDGGPLYSLTPRGSHASLTGFEALDALRKLADDPDVGVIRLLSGSKVRSARVEEIEYLGALRA